MSARVSRRPPYGPAVVLMGFLTLSACGGTPGVSGTTSTSTVPRHLLVATLADNGGLLSVKPNDRLKIVLPSSAWMFQASQYSRVVHRVTGGGVTPAKACNAGTGCGSVTVYFEMGSRGNAVLKASCTDSALCAGLPASFSLRLNVT